MHLAARADVHDTVTMSDVAIAVVSVAVGAAGVLVGWFVSGTQRVMEKLTEDRRRAYLELLLAADVVHRDGRQHGGTLQDCAAAARLLGSQRMHESRCITDLVRDVHEQDWSTGPRAWFVDLARLETQRNSRTRQRFHRLAYADPNWRWSTRRRGFGPR
jgi:hypothetical protein